MREILKDTERLKEIKDLFLDAYLVFDDYLKLRQEIDISKDLLSDESEIE